MTKFPSWLIEGHHRFRSENYLMEPETFLRLAEEGQAPRVMIVGCSDSRVDPKLIFAAEPGDLFVVRNVANLVPPYEPLGGYHGVSAALEFGVVHLEIEHLVVLGHTGCGGVKAMLDPSASLRNDMVFISNWVAMMAGARDEVMRDFNGASFDEKMEALEQRSIGVSLDNLRSFPFVRSREDEGKLTLHGAYFDVASGSLFVRHDDTARFEKI